MKRIKALKIILVVMLLSNVSFAIQQENINIEIKWTNAFEEAKEKGMYTLLTSEMPRKIFKTKRDVRLFEGKYMTKGYYFENPDPRITIDKGDWIGKEEYEKNANLYIDRDGVFTKDILHTTLPKDTLFELVEIKLDDWNISRCHYYVKFLDVPEYKDIKIDAVAIAYMGGDEGKTWNSQWKFVNWKTLSVDSKNIPLFMKKWAKEISEKKYEEYK